MPKYHGNPFGWGQNYRDKRNKQLQDGLDKLKLNPANSNETPIERLLRKISDVEAKAIAHLRPICQAGGGFDKAALSETCFKMMHEVFDSKQLFSREELVIACTMAHADRLMAKIDTDPGGTGTSDAIAPDAN